MKTRSTSSLLWNAAAVLGIATGGFIALILWKTYEAAELDKRHVLKATSPL